MFVLLPAYLPPSRVTISTVGRAALPSVVRRWKPNEANESVVSFRGGIQRFTDMMVRCHQSTTSHGVLHMEDGAGYERMTLLAVDRRGMVVGSLTSHVSNARFLATVHEMRRWHERTLGSALFLHDPYIEDTDCGEEEPEF